MARLIVMRCKQQGCDFVTYDENLWVSHSVDHLFDIIFGQMTPEEYDEAMANFRAAKEENRRRLRGAKGRRPPSV